MNKPIFIDDETAKIACKLNLNKKTIIIDKIFIQSTMNLLFIMNNKPKMAYSLVSTDTRDRGVHFVPKIFYLPQSAKSV